jgi:hypothetical protein
MRSVSAQAKVTITKTPYRMAIISQDAGFLYAGFLSFSIIFFASLCFFVLFNRKAKIHKSIENIKQSVFLRVL